MSSFVKLKREKCPTLIQLIFRILNKTPSSSSQVMCVQYRHMDIKGVVVKPLAITFYIFDTFDDGGGGERIYV